MTQAKACGYKNEALPGKKDVEQPSPGVISGTGEGACSKTQGAEKALGQNLLQEIGWTVAVDF